MTPAPALTLTLAGRPRALDQLVHLVGVLAVVARRGLQLLDRDLEVGGGLLDRAVVLANRLDRLGDVEAGAEQGRPTPGCPLPE